MVLGHCCILPGGPAFCVGFLHVPGSPWLSALQCGDLKSYLGTPRL